MEDVFGDFHDQAAEFAHKVAVGFVGEVVHRRTVSEVDVIDHAHALEFVEEPVHGGLVHVGLVRLYLGSELTGVRVLTEVDEGPKDRSAWARHPPAVGSEGQAHLFKPVCCHPWRILPPSTCVELATASSSSAIVRRMRLRPLLALAAVAVVVSLSSGACAGNDESAKSTGRLKIATTVAPITSIVASIVGDRADVVGIVPEGTNSHTFEPKPSVVELLSTADVVYINGLGLEERTKELAEKNLKEGAAIVELGTMAIPENEYIYDFSFPKEDGKPNPHLWTDPTLARKYAEIVKDDMSKRDPPNAGYYAANYEKFSALIDELDKAMRESFATVAKRELLTYHDAYAYFAKTYGWKVIGAIQVSDFEDPTPAEVAALIVQVKAAGVRAIFGSEVFPSPVLDQIGKEAGVKYVHELRDDDLPGKPGAPEHSWLGLMRFNYITMTEALGGDATALKAVELRNVAPDKAKYPQ